MAIAVAFYAAVIWMIVDIVRRPHFSDLAKALWIVTALLFSIGALIVYLFWVRNKDYSKA